MHILDNTTIIITIDLTFALLYTFIPIYLYASSRGLYKADYNSVFLLLICPFLLISDAGSWFFDGRLGDYARVGVTISYFIQYLIQYSMMAVASEAVLDILQAADGHKRLWLRYMERIIYAILVITLVATPFTGLYYTFDASNHFVRYPAMMITTVLSAVMLAGLIITAAQNRKKMRLFSPRLFAILCVLILAAMIFQYVLHGISIINLIICLSITLLTISYHSKRRAAILQRQQHSAEQSKELARQDLMLEKQRTDLSHQSAELARTKMLLLRSHMKPKFLFAALDNVHDTIFTNPKQAIDSIEAISTFLRHSIRVTTHSELNPLPQEIELVEKYLYLLSQQSTGRVQLDLDLEETDFSLPVLTLQPLVEAAVLIGFEERGGSGRIRISSWWEDNHYYVNIEDDGTCFKPELLAERLSSENTLDNMRLRMKRLLGGSILAGIDPSIGTTVTLIIPDTPPEGD